MSVNQYILTVAGFDPCSGAGLTADLKTFESLGFYGLAVCTAITVQNESEFLDVKWVDFDLIAAQIRLLFKQYTIPVVKIGIVISWEVMLEVVKLLKFLNPEIKIILDPIFRASAGFDFHGNENQKVLYQLFQHCYAITPNYEEINWLFPELPITETIENLAQITNVYLKGGHNNESLGQDVLYYDKIVALTIYPENKEIYPKHGSGCVLSSAFASFLAKGLSIDEAAKNAKYYTETYLLSSNELLGKHSYYYKQK